MSQIISSAEDIFLEIKQHLEKKQARRVFVFTGKSSFANASYREQFENVFKSCEKVHFFNELIPNPTIESIIQGVSEFRTGDWDLVIAIGGGSVIDSAKIITFFAKQEFSIQDYFSLKPENFTEIPEIWAIPTTSGTGSESTQFATFYINKVKHSLDLIQILPRKVFLHSIFTMELPPYITACTAADALCQAIESYWNVKSTAESRELAAKAIKLIYNSFEKCVLEPNAKARTEMAIGSNLAGQAIQITRTTAAHAVSYPMTSFFDIPHGQAVCATLPSFLSFNGEVSESDLSDPRGVKFVKEIVLQISNMLGCGSADEARKKLGNLFQKCGLKITLRDLGITSQGDLDIIIQNGFNPARVKNNPRLVTEENLRQLLVELT